MSRCVHTLWAQPNFLCTGISSWNNLLLNCVLFQISSTNIFYKTLRLHLFRTVNYMSKHVIEGCNINVLSQLHYAGCSPTCILNFCSFTATIYHMVLTELIKYPDTHCSSFCVPQTNVAHTSLDAVKVIKTRHPSSVRKPIKTSA